MEQTQMYFLMCQLDICGAGKMVREVTVAKRPSSLSVSYMVIGYQKRLRVKMPMEENSWSTLTTKRLPQHWSSTMNLSLQMLLDNRVTSLLNGVERKLTKGLSLLEDFMTSSFLTQTMTISCRLSVTKKVLLAKPWVSSIMTYGKPVAQDSLVLPQTYKQEPNVRRQLLCLNLIRIAFQTKPSMQLLWKALPIRMRKRREWSWSFRESTNRTGVLKIT